MSMVPESVERFVVNILRRIGRVMPKSVKQFSDNIEIRGHA